MTLFVGFRPTQGQLCRIPYFGPRVRCRLKYLHALENDQGFLAHTPLGIGVPPTIFNNKHSKIGLKFGVLAVITLGPEIFPLLNSSRNLQQTDCHTAHHTLNVLIHYLEKTSVNICQSYGHGQKYRGPFLTHSVLVYALMRRTLEVAFDKCSSVMSESTRQ